MKTNIRISRSERAGVLVWLLMATILYALPEWMEPAPRPEEAGAFREAVLRLRDDPAYADWFEQAQHIAVDSPPADSGIHKQSAAFAFDPNTAGEDELLRLGLAEKTVRGILRYRESGGRFRRPEDFGKIYTLPRADYERLLPYVRLAGEAPRTEKRPRTTSLDVNEAGAEEWESLPGIGPGFAGRIVRFREALGGFLSVEQVSETFGLPDSVFRRIAPLLVCNGRPPRTLDPNHATEEELAAHPYISQGQARAVVRYRERSGAFPTVDALQILSPFEGSQVPFSKIKPYLKIQ